MLQTLVDTSSIDDLSCRKKKTKSLDPVFQRDRKRLMCETDDMCRIMVVPRIADEEKMVPSWKGRLTTPELCNCKNVDVMRPRMPEFSRNIRKNDNVTATYIFSDAFR